MRPLLRIAILAAAPLATGCAILARTHVGEGRTQVPYRGQRATGLSARIGFAVDALPTWAFAATMSRVSAGTAGYFEPRCFTYVGNVKTQTGCNPWISASATALEVQKRWRPQRRVHPLATAALGHVKSGFTYAASGASYSGVTDSVRTPPFVSLGGGGELNIARWLHLALTADYRGVFGRSTASAAPSGLMLTSLLIIGKPYR